jgi:8-hydroxy-5-deazaflavin:NADPH oxidoreductase
MNVGILGSGEVGQALGTGFVDRGHEVTLGSRTPKGKRPAAWLSSVKGKGSVGTYEAASRAEVVVLAFPGEAAETGLRTAGIPNFDGKLVIDATNAWTFRGSEPGLLYGTADSVGERVQRILPKGKVVKAFNTVPSTQMVNPKFAGGAPDMLIAGNDTRAKARVVAILKEFGWPGALDVGRIPAARWLEANAILWYLVGGAFDRWDHAFKVVHG